MLSLLTLCGLFTLSLGQGYNTCVYRIAGISLDLREYAGQTLYYQGNDGLYEYTVCTDGLYCERNSVTRKAMIDYHQTGIDECVGVGNWDPNVLPNYDPYVASFYFNYTSNENCTDTRVPQTNRSVIVAWTCNEFAQKPVIVDVNHYNQCNDFVQVEYIGACEPVPPPNEECVFRDVGHVLNISSIKGTNLTYVDANGNTLEYSPCENKFKCGATYGQVGNMVQLNDRSGQCIKYFAIFSGDSNVFYDRTIFGQNYYEFFWANGQQCGDGGPNEILNIRYYCGSKTNGTRIISFAPVGPTCQFRMEIESPLACDS